MKVIIAGSRKGVKYTDVLDAIRLSGYSITEVVSGGAAGADTFGEVWAGVNRKPIKTFYVEDADWDKNMAAGKLRNTRMADYADALIAVWFSKSGGTADMIAKMKSRGKPVYVHEL
jgi:hypothetical protein